MKLQSLLTRLETIFYDQHFSTVQQWKDYHHGKAIGYMPVFVPREIFHAAHILPVGIMGGGDQIEIIKGDAYFQSYICHIPRSTIELALSGHLDCLDGMVFPAICDVIRNLSGMWKLLFPTKYVKYLDVPQNFDTEIGGKFFSHEINEMIENFQNLSGKKISHHDLQNSIALYNQNRTLISELYALRSKIPWNVPTEEVYLIMRAGMLVSVEEHNEMLQTYMRLATERNNKPRDNSRVIISGAFCEQPPLALIKTLERSGCYIVDDDFHLGLRFHDNINVQLSPIDAIVDAYLNHAVSTSSRYDPSDNKGQYLVDSFISNRAEGIIFAAPSFCDPALLDQPMLVSKLEEHDIPYTSFKYAENTGQFQSIREQAGTFTDSLKLWSK